MDIITTKIDHTTYTHRVLWTGVQHQLEQANSEEKGSWHFWLSAMIMGYMVYEAYLNYVGDELAPEIWQKEREHFSSPPHKGSEGKLRFLLERYNMPFPDKNKRPFASVYALKDIRDEIVHAKPYKTKYTTTHPADSFPPMSKEWLENKVNKAQATRLLNDLEQFLEETHIYFRGCDDGHSLLSSALTGILSSSTSWGTSRG